MGAPSEVDAATIEGQVLEWFLTNHGMKLSSIEIIPEGDAGGWRIGHSTRLAFVGYHDLAQACAAELATRYKLRRV